MFYGGRNNLDEFFYGKRIIEIFKSLRSHGIDANIYIAWSRECSSNGNEENDWVKLKKGYVQDYFKEP
jgi:sulfite reductase alpha subunit-like flavoprotein